MPNPYFKFKQFTVWHDRCAMKVGTDGVLLGTCAHHPKPETILDIGTGTGLVALILAQRFPQSIIEAIEIDPEAAQQASENIANSPFSSRIKVTNLPLQLFLPDTRYSLIVCNPPFFKVSSRSESASRNLARQTESLNPEAIFAFAQNHLAHNGRLVIIFPARDDLSTVANHFGFFPAEKCLIKGHAEAEVKRVVWTFSQETDETKITELVIENARNQYTPEFTALAKDFYLNL